MRRILVLLAACVLVLAACGGDDGEPDVGQEPEMEQEQEADDGGAVTIQVGDSDLGEIVVDAEGNTLYMFVPDEEENGEPTCYDECAQTWPPFEAMGDLSAGESLDQSMLGTVERTDGSDQVTFNNLPLYYFSGDEAAGDTNGQGLNDVWWVLSPEGQPIRDGQSANGEPYGAG